MEVAGNFDKVENQRLRNTQAKKQKAAFFEEGKDEEEKNCFKLPAEYRISSTKKFKPKGS